MGLYMGHRLTTALIFLNAMGLFACLILIAANGNQTLRRALSPEVPAAAIVDFIP